MKKIFMLSLMAIAMTITAFSAKRAIPIRTHQNGENTEDLIKEDRNPIIIPVAVYYDSDTNILEVWCDDDNIQAEVYVYDETGAVEAYSPFMNVTLTITSGSIHTILIKGIGWEANGII